MFMLVIEEEEEKVEEYEDEDKDKDKERDMKSITSWIETNKKKTTSIIRQKEGLGKEGMM